jgi:hypothetical protein
MMGPDASKANILVNVLYLHAWVRLQKLCQQTPMQQTSKHILHLANAPELYGLPDTTGDRKRSNSFRLISDENSRPVGW